jgi:hypothetical protein
LTRIDALIRETLHAAAGNPVLAEVSERLYAQTFRLWYTVMDRGGWNEEVLSVLGELDKVLECFASGSRASFGEIRRNQLVTHVERLRHKFLGPRT